MKYSLIFIIALSASLTASAGFLDKVKKGVSSATKVAGDVLDPEAAEQKKQEAARQAAAQKRKETAAASKATKQKEQEDLVVEKSQKENEEQKLLKELEASRGGVVAYAPLDIRWGDSPEVLSKTCGMNVFDHPFFNSWCGESVTKNGDERRVIHAFVDQDTGVFRINIKFSVMYVGAVSSVTTEDLKKKYIGMYGVPEELHNDPNEVKVIGYRWVAKEEVVTLHNNAIGIDAEVVLENLEMIKRHDESVQNRSEKAEEERKAKSNKLLDF